MSASSSAAGTVLFTYAIIVLIVALRTVRNFRGVQVSAIRTIGYTVFYFAFGAFLVVPSFFIEGVPLIYSAPDVAVLIAAATWSYRYSDRRISFWKTASGAIYYKGGIIIYLIYIAGLIARLAAEYVFTGQSAFTFSATTAINPSELVGLVIIDLLVVLGIGLLIGRNMRIYKRYQSIMQGKETVSSVPQKYGSV